MIQVLRAGVTLDIVGVQCRLDLKQAALLDSEGREEGGEGGRSREGEGGGEEKGSEEGRGGGGM